MKTYVVGQVPSGYAPLPPENVLINGARYPADISGQYTISWAPNPRERVYGPAASGDETYTLRLYDETDTLRRTVTGITGNSYTWSTEVMDSGLGTLEDTFAVDSTTSYTQYGDTPTTWTVSGGELLSGVGIHTSFIRNGASYTDVAIEADMNYAVGGVGLTLRHIDVNNYYALFLSDDSGSDASGNVRLRKRVAGTFSPVGTDTDIIWPRGTSKTFRLSAIGSTISVHVDGGLVISVTDTGVAGPGGVGLRSSAGATPPTGKFQAFRWNVQAGPARYNSSVRAELETVRGGVTSYQKQIIKTLRSVTTV
jgi:hypothetical protein